MSYSLLSLAGDTKSSAMKGLRDAAELETKRENNNEQLKAAEKQQTMSAVGTGAAIGTAITSGVGTAIMPGVGTAVGAAAGYIVGSLF